MAASTNPESNLPAFVQRDAITRYYKQPGGTTTTRFHKIIQRIPYTAKIREGMKRIPPKYKLTCVTVWILWKVLALIIVVVYSVGSTQTHNLLRNNGSRSSSRESPTKVLYIVTSLTEFNNGKRATKAGQDRLQEIMLPILVDGVESMVLPPFQYQVDVALILAYQLKPERAQLIQNALPPNVGLYIWDDACPLGYDDKHDAEHILDNTRALARQHRYLVKDKLQEYDVFLAFEDDMRITGQHISHYLNMSQELDKLRSHSPESLPDVPENMDPKQMKFHGPMTRSQMDRILPGFVRVEVLREPDVHGAQAPEDMDPIPLDYNFNNQECHFEPHTCCHVQMNPNVETPIHPKREDVIIWETNVRALSVRKLPKGSDVLDWVTLLPGPGKRLPKDQLVGGYWSGRNNAFGDEPKPSPGMPDLIAQQGGWMATREQLLRLDQHCQGSFLPPFDEPIYRHDGQESMNVEFWSGGYQLFTGVRGGCNMQRIMSLHPDHFSSQFIYHVANNKQRQLAQRRMVRADHLWAQLNSVRKMAESEI